MAYKEDTNSQLIVTIGAVSGFLVIMIVIGLQAWFISEEQSELDQKYATMVNTELLDLRKKQQDNITSFRWIDKDKKIAAIPIDRAMKALVENKGQVPEK